jgi:hypothetical protein
MLVNLEDASLKDRRETSWGTDAFWFRFWRKLFGRPIPISGDRAHLGHLLLTYRPGEDLQQFIDGRMHTDAARVHAIGDLLIFDYLSKPRKVETFENKFFSKFDEERHKDMPAFDQELLDCNQKEIKG